MHIGKHSEGEVVRLKADAEYAYRPLQYSLHRKTSRSTAIILISPMQESLVYEIDTESQYWRDWRLEATDRPNEVLYVLVVYGIDARHWEELARHARRNHNSNSTIAFLD